jgi:hypothetical protein
MITKEQEAAENARRKRIFEEYQLSEDYQTRLKQRLEISAACEKSAQSRALTWQLCARPENAAEGCIFFIENFGWSLDPRPERPAHHLPFLLFGYQKDAIKWLIDHVDSGRDGLIEKSRDMGVSWLVFVWVTIWYWLFRDGVNFLIGSYKEALVDNKSIDSLFGKIDYSIESIPQWMMPKGFRADKHRTKLRLINPANGNEITGDTMSSKFGRGARKTAVLYDELGFWDYAEDSWKSSGDSTSCRIANSTPNGQDYYANLRESGMDVLTLHWKAHPLKDEEWYAYECARRTPEEVAAELDISYTKSKSGKVYPEWNESNVTEGHFPYDPNKPLYISWDFGRNDGTAIIWSQPESNGALRIIDYYYKVGKKIDYFVPFINGIISSEGYEYDERELEMIEEHKEWKPGTHFGDPSGRYTNQITDDTVISILRNWGIIVNFKERWQYFNLRRVSGKRRIESGINLNLNERTKSFKIAMINSSYPKVKIDGMDVYRTEKPKHDGYSHGRTSFEYLSMGLEDFKKVAPQIHDKFPPRVKNTSIRRKRSLGY